MNDVARQGPLLVVEHLSKSYGAVEALRDVSFELREGEVVGLVGDNGAGKSTLVKCISGAIHPTEGSIVLDGTTRRFDSPAEARASGVETVYQDLALVELFDLTANLYLGRELVRPGRLGRLGLLDKRAMDVSARAAIAQLPTSFPDLGASIDTMSGGQRQVVAITKAAYWSRRLLLLDEPTAALGVKEAAGVLDMITHIAGRADLSIMVIAHNLQHIFAICSRVLVMRRGSIVADLAVGETSAEQVVAYVTGAR